MLRIDVAHEVRGMVGSVTSYSDIGGGTQYVVNDVALAYNHFGLVATEEQSHSGRADGSKPKAQYTYADGSQNTVRLTKVTYPSSTGGREVEYDYASDADADHLSRVYWLKFQGQAVTRYKYLGSGSVVQTDHPQPGVSWTLINAVGGDRYANLDRFGRVVNAPWTKTSPGDLAQLKYGYDAAGNRLWREDVLAAYSPYNKDLDELYTYDGVNRLTNAQRGDLYDNQGTKAIQSKNFEHDWTLDGLGNWPTFKEDTDGTGWALEQTRYHNKANEIAGNSGNPITQTTGAAWHDPVYDAAGNMTEGPSGLDPTAGHKYVYDAWNRLVKVTDANDTTIAEFEYDGLGRRIVKKTNYSGGSPQDTYDYYYNASYQVVEVRKNGSGNALEQYVYHPYYIDAVAVRYYDADTDGQNVATHYYTQDANFNVTAVLDDTGAVLERYRYTPYGAATFLQPDFTERNPNASTIGNAVLYTGRRLDAETGLQYSRYRYYHSHLARFVNRDPIGYRSGDANLYRYVGNRPTDSMDPIGIAIYVAPYTMPRPVPLRNPDGSIRTDSHGNALIQPGEEIDQSATVRWGHDVFQALFTICPCIKLEGQWNNKSPVRGLRLYGVPNPDTSFGDTADKENFCRCVRAHQGGCTLLHDLLTATGRNNVVLKHFLLNNGKFVASETSPRRIGTLYWNPKYQGPELSPTSEPATVLAHELTHAWTVLEGPGGRHPIDPSKVANLNDVIQMQPNGKPDRDYPAWGEVYAVRAENQIGREITGRWVIRTQYQVRLRSRVVTLPQPDKDYFDRPCECAKWHHELVGAGWGK